MGDDVQQQLKLASLKTNAKPNRYWDGDNAVFSSVALDVKLVVILDNGLVYSKTCSPTTRGVPTLPKLVDAVVLREGRFITAAGFDISEAHVRLTLEETSEEGVKEVSLQSQIADDVVAYTLWFHRNVKCGTKDVLKVTMTYGFKDENMTA